MISLVKQVPDAVALEVQAIFAGLSLTNSDLGVMDYLRGHLPMGEEPLMVLPAVAGDESSQPSFDLTLFRSVENRTAAATTENTEERALLQSFDDGLQQYEQQGEVHRLRDADRCTLLYALRTLRATEHSPSMSSDTLAAAFERRARLTTLRLQCFFVLIHSKLKSASIRRALRPDSVFMKDLVELSDVASDVVEELGQGALSVSRHLSLAAAALECLLGLLENKLRKRKFLDSSILDLIGLSRNSEGGGFNSEMTEGGDLNDAWSTIIMSACSLTSSLLENRVVPTSSAFVVDRYVKCSHISFYHLLTLTLIESKSELVVVTVRLL